MSEEEITEVARRESQIRGRILEYARNLRPCFPGFRQAIKRWCATELEMSQWEANARSTWALNFLRNYHTANR